VMCRACSLVSSLAATSVCLAGSFDLWLCDAVYNIALPQTLRRFHLSTLALWACMNTHHSGGSAIGPYYMKAKLPLAETRKREAA